MMKIAAAVLATLCAACVGDPFTVADPFASSAIVAENDGGNPGSRVALAEPPSGEDAGVADHDPKPANVVQEDAGARPDALAAAEPDAAPPTPACVPTPYLQICPAQASNWPLCGRHPDGCGGFYDCGEPCPVPPGADAGKPDAYVPPGACDAIAACNGCSIVGAVNATEQAPCQAAIANADAQGCANYLATARSDGLLCN